jgi:hypothetical protein
MSATANAALAKPWNDLWDGDLSIADEIIAEDFVAHAAPITGQGGDEIHGREALKQWIGGTHGVLQDLTFTVQVDRDRRRRLPGGSLDRPRPVRGWTPRRI